MLSMTTYFSDLTTGSKLYSQVVVGSNFHLATFLVILFIWHLQLLSSNNEPACRSLLPREYLLTLWNDNGWPCSSCLLPARLWRPRASPLFSALCFCSISIRKRCLSRVFFFVWLCFFAFYINALLFLCIWYADGLFKCELVPFWLGLLPLF